MALYVADAAWTAAISGGTWKVLISEALEAAPVRARASPWRLGSCNSSAAATGSVRTLINAARFPRGATRQEAPTSAAKALSNSASGVRMKERGWRPSPPPAEAKSREDAGSLESLSADAAVACLQLLAVECKANLQRPTAEVVKDGGATANIARLTAKSAEVRGRERSSNSAKPLAQGTETVAGRAADDSREAAEGRTAGAAALECDGLHTHGMQAEEKLRAARVLLQLYVEKKDDLSGRSVLKLLNAMLTLRIYAREVLTELAETIRRRLLRVLPPDGLAAIVGTYCFFFTTPQKCAKAASGSNCVTRLDRMPAPVQDLLCDAFEEIWVRGGRARYHASALHARGAVVSHVEANSAKSFLPNKCSEELPCDHILQRNAANEETADSAVGENVDWHSVSQRDVNHARNHPVGTKEAFFASVHEKNRLSRAGVVSCAWALSRLTFSRKSMLSEHLKEFLTGELSRAATACINHTRSSLVHGSVAWKEEVSRLQEWGATAAAFVRLPGDHSSRVAVTAKKEVTKALQNLRLALLQDKNTFVPDPPHKAPLGAMLVHKHMMAFSSQARASIIEGFHLDELFRGRLQKPKRNDSTKWLSVTEQSKHLAFAGARKDHPLTICDEDAAIICEAVTSVLRLSAVTQHDNAPILEALQALHGEDPFMFSLPKTDICYFLAAAQEGAVVGLQVTGKETLIASLERGMTPHSSHGPPSLGNPGTKGFFKLPAFLYWTLLLFPRVATAGEGLFEIMPPRVVALLLSMLSFLPGSLATCEERRISLACNSAEKRHAVFFNTEGCFPSRQHRDAHFITTRSRKQQRTSSIVREDLDVQIFVMIEEQLRKFSCDLCRVVVERAACFGKQDLVTAISAIKRLERDARQLPFSGGSWLQHPDFSRVLDCLLRAVRRRRQSGSKRVQTHAARVGDSSAGATLDAWHAHEQQLSDDVDEPSGANSKQGDRIAATKLKGVFSADNVAQGRDDWSDATRRVEQCQELLKFSATYSTAKDDFSMSQVLPTWMQSGPHIGLSHPVERRCGSDTGKSRVCFTASYPADAGEDTRLWQLVCHVLRPCYSEHKVNKTALNSLLSSAKERNFGGVESENRSVPECPKERTTCEWRCSPSFCFEERIKNSVRCTAERQNTGASALLNTCAGGKRDNEHVVKRPGGESDSAQHVTYFHDEENCLRQDPTVSDTLWHHVSGVLLIEIKKKEKIIIQRSFYEAAWWCILWETPVSSLGLPFL